MVVLWRFHDLTIETMSPALCVAFRVYLHYYVPIACMHTASSQEFLASLRHLWVTCITCFVCCFAARSGTLSVVAAVFLSPA